MADGVGLHMLGKSSYDPMTTERYSRKDNTFSIESIYGQAHDPSYSRARRASIPQEPAQQEALPIILLCCGRCCRWWQWW